MKTILKFTLLCILFLSFNACKKDTTTDLTYGIDPVAQKDLLCKALRLLGNNKDGNMPSGVGSGAPIVVSYPQAVEVSAGVLLFIPYQVLDTNQICNIYLQVAGADNYWETKLTLDPTTRQPYFKILIPKFVREGEFDLVFSVADCNGNVSKLYSTNTTVSPIADCGTGISGSVGITVRAFDLGDKAGIAKFMYEMYSIPDRLDIRYNGQWVASTGQLFDNSVTIPNCNGNGDGFVSDDGILSFPYDPRINRFVEVYVSGCNAGTEWDVDPMCP
jgi:hypothetical protein